MILLSVEICNADLTEGNSIFKISFYSKRTLILEINTLFSIRSKILNCYRKNTRVDNATFKSIVI